MIDPISAARSARENLAQGLAALQDPGIPAELSDVAEPVAQAMSALHRIESTGGAALAESAPIALNAVRRALSRLQAQPPSHPALNQAVEAVAGSLGIVHSLSQQVSQQRAPVAGAPIGQTVVIDPRRQQAPPGSAAPPTQPSAADPPAPVPVPLQHPVAPPPQPVYAPSAPQAPNPNPYGSPPGSWAQTAPSAGAPAAPPQQPAWPAAAQQPAWPAAAQQPAWPAAAQQPAWPPAAQPAAPPASGLQPGPAPQPYPPPGTAAPGAPSQGQAIAGGGPAVRVDAELGAHSATNFYKGLSGNDVIDSGGIFVATYQIPEIGQNLIIKVSLPGGYEFEAMGVVRWTREAPNSGSDSSPGFGAQFTQISPEGRQLVYRYVRNREPLFHDDL